MKWTPMKGLIRIVWTVLLLDLSFDGKTSCWNTDYPEGGRKYTI